MKPDLSLVRLPLVTVIAPPACSGSERQHTARQSQVFSLLLTPGFFALCVAFIALCGASSVTAQAVASQSTVADHKVAHLIPVHNVRRVVVETPGDLEILPGGAERLIIDAEPEVIQRLDAVVKQGTLYLRSKESFTAHSTIRYTLEIPTLETLVARGNGNMDIGAFHGSTLDIELGGIGDATLKGISVDQLTLRISGSGRIHADGRGKKLIVEISGVGAAHAEKFVVAQAETKISGSGDINVHADKLNVVIEGVGAVRYKGHPEINQSVSGAGSVEPFQKP
jgi:hypothetical protein